MHTCLSSVHCSKQQLQRHMCAKHRGHHWYAADAAFVTTCGTSTAVHCRAGDAYLGPKLALNRHVDLRCTCSAKFLRMIALGIASCYFARTM